MLRVPGIETMNGFWAIRLILEGFNIWNRANTGLAPMAVTSPL
jgi:hypothetical protein